MKQTDMNEPWLDEIRQTMTDYKEELPADGWERLSAAKPARWVVPIWLSRVVLPAARVEIHSLCTGVLTGHQLIVHTCAG